MAKVTYRKWEKVDTRAKGKQTNHKTKQNNLTKIKDKSKPCEYNFIFKHAYKNSIDDSLHIEIRNILIYTTRAQLH